MQNSSTLYITKNTVLVAQPYRISFVLCFQNQTYENHNHSIRYNSWIRIVFL